MGKIRLYAVGGFRMNPSLIPVVSSGSNEGHDKPGDFMVEFVGAEIRVWNLLYAVLKELNALQAQSFLIAAGEDPGRIGLRLGWSKSSVLAARDALYGLLCRLFPDHTWHLTRGDEDAAKELESWDLVQ
jgi:hypothetical protein